MRVTRGGVGGRGERTEFENKLVFSSSVHL